MRSLLCLLAVMTLGAQSPSRITWPVLSATGTTTGFNTPMNGWHTLQVVLTGSPASCTVNLEGTIDGSHWYDLSGGQACDATAQPTAVLMFHVANKPVVQVRAHLTALSAAATATITYGGVNGGRIQ